MFSYYPDKRWLQASAFINCKPALVAGIVSAKEG